MGNTPAQTPVYEGGASNTPSHTPVYEGASTTPSHTPLYEVGVSSTSAQTPVYEGASSEVHGNLSSGENTPQHDADVVPDNTETTDRDAEIESEVCQDISDTQVNNDNNNKTL